MDWCMANIGIGAPRQMRSALMQVEKVDGELAAIGLDQVADGREGMPQSAEKDSQDHLLNPSPPLLTSSAPTPGEREAEEEEGEDTRNLPPKLPFSLPKPLFSPPPRTAPYPIPLLSADSYYPRSLPTLLLSLIDSPAYSNLTTSYLKGFNKRTLDDPDVRSSFLDIFVD